jgi:phosphocarrier protein
MHHTRTAPAPAAPAPAPAAPPAAAGPLLRELVVQNKMGIHARPAAMIVRITNKYKSEVFVEKDGEQVNG